MKIDVSYLTIAELTGVSGSLNYSLLDLVARDVMAQEDKTPDMKEGN